MKADILRQGSLEEDIDIDQEGNWQTVQDPLTWEIIRKWVPVVDDNPDTPEVDKYSVPCAARGIITNGITAVGTTERFGDRYMNIDFVRMSFPQGVVISKRDRITNIRDAVTGRIMWLDEESPEEGGEFRSTVFNVQGVTPVVDGMGRWVENVALLERATEV